MKKLNVVFATLLASSMVAATGGGFDVTSVNSASVTASGTSAVSGVIGNGAGESVMNAGAVANNTTRARADGNNGLFKASADTAASSQGGSHTFASGETTGSATGLAGGVAGQHGSATSSALGVSLKGPAGATSAASVKSLSASGVVRNGDVYSGTETLATHQSSSSIKKVNNGVKTKSSSTGGSATGSYGYDDVGGLDGTVTGGFAGEAGAAGAGSW